jgi:hypothetical protein
VHILAGNPRAEGGRRVLFYSGHDPMLLAISILAALYRRRDTGQGASASRSPCWISQFFLHSFGDGVI